MVDENGTSLSMQQVQHETLSTQTPPLTTSINGGRHPDECASSSNDDDSSMEMDLSDSSELLEEDDPRLSNTNHYQENNGYDSDEFDSETDSDRNSPKDEDNYFKSALL